MVMATSGFQGCMKRRCSSKYARGGRWEDGRMSSRAVQRRRFVRLVVWQKLVREDANWEELDNYTW